MKLNSQYFTLGALVIVSGLFWFYHGKYQDKAEAYARLQLQYQEQVAINTTQQERIRRLAELDIKHTQELTNAKSKIDELHTASLAHPERVFIKAKCPVLKTPAPSGVDDAATARPTDSAIRNYWLLRERIATSEQMILGLQEYVRAQCR
ncbi:phosphoprotein phosphatase [Xenorhabdus beddingii]|uniref:Phosphoprotein phosphatase n=1 Tax=Xenorhabdus beddingii TaxID=40578 RepID=A0A1Y2S9S4_9GAMM|nr:lysis protein [Xenorhabdus beddingii]OTA14293.1 phosphoprotein phosphatase [Xenorhabdus beddingii]